MWGHEGLLLVQVGFEGWFNTWTRSVEAVVERANEPKKAGSGDEGECLHILWYLSVNEELWVLGLEAGGPRFYNFSFSLYSSIWPRIHLIRP
jgi:hypothetical protein